MGNYAINRTLSNIGMRLALATFLAAGLLFVLAISVQAAPAAQESEEGCGCHSAETETWLASPHAQLKADGTAVATCESCHGAYVRGHPEEGMIPLKADSSVCSTCHDRTFGEWDGTVHAQAGVQCISCHVSHSQDLRLTDEKLCQSCHRDSLEDPLHTAHWIGDATCTSCHLSDSQIDASQSVASADPTAILSGTPRHDFVSVSSRNCLDCHKKTVSAGAQPAQGDYALHRELLQTASTVPMLRAELVITEQANRTLALLNPVSLGFGISIGGLLGIVFVLAMISLNRRKGGGPE